MAARKTAARIRWDRVGRVALLLVLVGVLALYVNPLRFVRLDAGRSPSSATPRSPSSSARTRSSRARRAELRDPRALEREARRLGMVRPGERAYVVEGLGR